MDYFNSNVRFLMSVFLNFGKRVFEINDYLIKPLQHQTTNTQILKVIEKLKSKYLHIGRFSINNALRIK